jgi:UDP-N-acetylmuramoyl-L-alanyl-D-glutamate--2,6-diaminopimelate ligase
MDLARLIQGQGVERRGIAASRPVDIAGIGDDSRCVGPGWLYVARGGTRDDGRNYIAHAISRGAAAVLVDSPISGGLAEAVELLAPPEPGLAVTAARLAERFFGSPSQHLALVGITGTNGKTTTAHLTQQILAYSGVRTGLIGTVVVDDGLTRERARWTTPPPAELSRSLAAMVEHGCRAAAMEVSSHALHQHRTAGLAFRVAVFTNLTGDHLDYHGTMEAYGAAKAMLFESLPADGAAILNAMDPWSERMAASTRARVWRCRVGAAGAKGEECVATAGPCGMAGTRVEFEGPWGRFEALLPLVGTHNVMNSLQSAAAAWATGLVASREALASAIESIKSPPGRLERVSTPGDPFLVLVDYAHSDDALRNVLPAVRPLVGTNSNESMDRRKHGRLIVVFGCGGDRDRTKRPRMGAAAAELADEVWITSDNPRTENPGAIIQEILAGLPASSNGRVQVEEDRRKAIDSAIASLRPGDCLVIAGKGHEEEQIVADGRGGTRTMPFSDARVAREALAHNRGDRVSAGSVAASTSEDDR